MKFTRIYYLLMLVVVAGLSSCDRDDDNIYPQLGDDPRNIGQIVSETSSLSSFAGALAQTELDETLRTTSTYTVFAPNNTAFNGVDVSAMGEEELNNFLLNHIISTVQADFASTLTTGYRTTMATGPNGNNLSIFINTEETIRLNGVASLINNSSNIGSTNGVLHVIDAVLAPPTVVDHAQANPQFSILAQAIEIAGLTETLSINDEENENFPFTVFAPTNEAFENLLSTLNGAFGWTSLADIPVEVLQEILMYHVVAGENVIADAVGGTQPETLQGEAISISDANVITDGTPTGTNITVNNVQAINGIIHGIDRVLLPGGIYQDILGATLNLKDRSENRGYTSFLAAVQKAGLTSLLEDESAMYTVFAPNNEAFEALFSLITNFDSLDDFNTEEEIGALRALLTYHIHEGSIMSSQLTNGGTITTIHGDVITADLTGANARLRPSYSEALPSVISTPNIGATNGVIHGINRVLIPADLVGALGIPSDSDGGLCPVGDPNLVFFDWDEYGPWWGQVTAENNPSLSLDGSSYGRANFRTGGTGWQDLFWRNDPGTFRGAQIVGNNLTGYSLKFDINVLEPISQGRFRIRFNNSNGVDAFYDWAPWNETGEAFTTDGWETVEIPLTELGVPDFSLVNAEFGMAFEGADVLLNFAIDNVRFDTPGGCGGPDPVSNPEAVFFDWDEFGSWWGNVTAQNDPAISLDGSNYGRANFQTGTDGWVDLFWRNDAGTFRGANMVGTNVNDYVMKFDILTLAPITEGMFRFRFNNTNGVDAFYNWEPWNESGEPFDTGGNWVTVTIPASALGQPDFSAVNAEFGAAFQGANTFLNFAIDNIRFERR